MRNFLRPLILAITTVASFASGAQTFPAKPIRIVVPFSPGSGIDSTMRAIAAELTKNLGQAVYVENRAGAGGAIGTADVAKAAPDGYTLLAGTNGTHVVNPLIKKNLPYDAFKDFIPLVLVTQSTMFVSVNPKLGVENLAQLIELAKSKQVTFASAGPAHTLAIEYLGLRAGIKFSVIPYKGAAPAQTDTIAGHVDAYMDTGLAVLPLATTGKLKLLAVTSLQRAPNLPALPAIAETYPGYQATANVAALPSIQQVILDSAAIPVNGNSSAVEKWMADSQVLWSDVIQKTGIVLE
jgi:tripartite-type tricarboxylate transporter receptor subunit TctC